MKKLAFVAKTTPTKLKFKAEPANINSVDEIQPGDVLAIGHECMIKLLTNFISLRDNEIKVKWSEKHPEGVRTEEGTLNEFKKRILTLKDTYKASVRTATAKEARAFVKKASEYRLESAGPEEAEKAIALSKGTKWDFYTRDQDVRTKGPNEPAATFLKQHCQGSQDGKVHFLFDGNQPVACGYINRNGVLFAFDINDVQVNSELAATFKSMIESGTL